MNRRQVSALRSLAAILARRTVDGESVHVAGQHVRVGIKVAQMTGLYDEGMRDAWLEADRLGFDTGWLHDHLFVQT